MAPAPPRNRTRTRRTAVCLACQTTCTCGALATLAAPDSVIYQPTPTGQTPQHPPATPGTMDP